MKNLVLTVSAAIICNASFSQTFLAPGIGYDFMAMESVFIAPDFHGFEVINPPYSITGVHYGLEMEQAIYKKLSASVCASYAQRQAEASIYSPISLDGFTFDYWRANMSINYRTTSYLSIGIGYDYNQLKDLKYTFREQTYSRFKPLMIDQGLSINIRGHWKNIECKAYFHKGINSNISDSAHELSINPINYFGFNLAYRIKIFNGFKRDKKAACPTF